MQRIHAIRGASVFLLSVVFLSPALTPRAAGQDVAQLREELANTKALNQALQAEMEKMRAELAAQRAAEANLRAEFDKIRAVAEQLQKVAAARGDMLAKEMQTVVADAQRTKAEADTLRREVVTLRDELARLQAGGSPIARPVPPKPQDAPPQVDGAVLTVTDTGLVEISLGSDDGLKQGHRLEVYRAVDGQGIYVGRIEVAKTRPDKSVCKVMPEFEKRKIQKGDRVATKL